MPYSKEILIGSTLWKLLERFASQLISFFITVILARILMPQEYGIIAIVLVFINLANVVVDGGLNTALVQKKDADDTDFSTIFYFCMLLSIVLYVVLFFSAPFIARFYGNDVLVLVLRVLGLNVFFNSFCSIQRAYVSKHMLFRKLFYCTFGAVLISGAAGIIMAYSGYGVWALVCQQLVSQVVTLLLLFLFIPWRPKMSFSFDRFRSLFDFGWKIFLTNMLIEIYEDSRSLVIGRLYQPVVLAFFDKGKQIPSLFMSNITASIKTILLPAFSDIQKDVSEVKRVMKRATKLSCFFIVPALFGLIAVAEPFVSVLFTDKWLEIVPFIRIFCIAYLLLPVQSSNICAIQALGHSEITLKIEIIKKILEASILVISFMINVYAVAWGVVLYNFISMLINLYPNGRLVDYGIGEQIKDVLPIYISGFLMCICIYFLNYFNTINVLLLFIEIIIGIALYLLFCYCFKVDSLSYSINILQQRFK